MNDFSKIQSQLDKEAQRVHSVNILFLDLSSSCTGYSIFGVDFNEKKAFLKSCGSLWFNDDWDSQEKISYIFNAVMTYFEVVHHIDLIVSEQYSVNPKRMTGVMVIPELTGALKAAAAENGVKVRSMLPQSWRSELGIKKDPTNKDFKEPTKARIQQMIKVPDKAISNITGNERQTPYDVYDALGLGLGWLKRMGASQVDCSTFDFNPHIGIVNK